MTPHDIPLPFPASELLMKVLVVFSFLVHILFVNLMVGGSILTLFYEWRGRKQSKFDRVAFEIAKTVTVNKSLAVVMGVAPLLLINVLYTVWFYSANALTGTAWIMIVPLVTLAFLLTYLHQYTWDRLAAHRGIRLSIILAAVLLFLSIPLIFLANINLMLFPERWNEVHGFFSALALPNVFPRYFHFILASVAVTALFLVGWISRENGALKKALGSDCESLRREFYSICLCASGAQFVVGPLLLMTLPSQGISWKLLLMIFSGAFLAIPALVLLWRQVQGPFSWRKYVSIVSFLSATVVFMATGRHFYRESALHSHNQAMKARAEKYALAVEEAKKQAALGLNSKAVESRGKVVFRTCGACHGLNQRMVGPPLTEIAQIYAGNPQGIVQWAKAPGKKRPDYPQMIPMTMFSDADLMESAKYMLEAVARGSL